MFVPPYFTVCVQQLLIIILLFCYELSYTPQHHYSMLMCAMQYIKKYTHTFDTLQITLLLRTLHEILLCFELAANKLAPSPMHACVQYFAAMHFVPVDEENAQDKPSLWREGGLLMRIFEIPSAEMTWEGMRGPDDTARQGGRESKENSVPMSYFPLSPSFRLSLSSKTSGLRWKDHDWNESYFEVSFRIRNE